MGAALEDSDEQLVLLAKDGKLDAFNRLVDRHQGAVYGLCYRLLANREAAEDAAQETFLAAYRAMARFHGGSFRSWLLRIAANESRDELRRSRRRPVMSLSSSDGQSEEEIDLPDHAPGAADRIERLEMNAEVERLLLKLPFEQRQALVLVDVFDFQYDEVATMTRTSIGTIKSRIHRGRERLRQVIQTSPELSGRLRSLEGRGN
ncbi:MAG: RNA polymerase sigma factor [Dehalococcoidia bacterium]